MARTVWKFQLRHPRDGGDSTIQLPDIHAICHAAMQGQIPTLWAEVDPQAPLIRAQFRIFGTGHPIPDDKRLKHVWTIFDGPFVWHIYRVFGSFDPSARTT